MHIFRMIKMPPKVLAKAATSFSVSLFQMSLKSWRLLSTGCACAKIGNGLISGVICEVVKFCRKEVDHSVISKALKIREYTLLIRDPCYLKAILTNTV